MEIISTRFEPTPFDGLGPAARTAYHPNAPVDEAEDAGQMLMKAYGGYGLPNQMDIVSIVQQTMRLKKAERLGDGLLIKALAMMHPEAAEQKARTEPWVQKVGGGGKYIPKPGIPFLVLRQLSKRIEVAQAIHRVWMRKAKLFAKPSTKPDEPGFELFHLDPMAELDEKQGDFLRWVSLFLYNGGRDFNARTRKMKRRETMPTWVQKAVQDSLTLDWVCTEKVPLIEGVPGLDSFYCRDSATFYLANFGRELEEGEAFAYQLAYGTEEVMFEADELAIWQRNLDSDLNSAGYSISELEAGVDTLSNWITAMQYTKNGLDQNSIPRGILSIFGQFDRNTKQLFKQAWDAKVRGVANSFNLPILFGGNGQTGDVKFTPTGEPFNEMAFAKWISLQASILGAIYGTDPKEIGLDSFTAQSTSSLGGDDTEEKLLHSRDTNFNPFMHAMASHLQDELVSPFGDWIGVRFTGLIDESAQERQKEKRRMMTINEVRKELSMDPHPLGWFGALPADPGLLTAEFQRMQATLTYDEARQAWGGLKVFPSELVGMAPINPSMGALYNMAAQAAGQESSGEGDGEDTGADAANPFQALNPGQGDGQPKPMDEDGSQETQDEEGDTSADTDSGLFEGSPEDEGSDLKKDVADKLGRV